MSMYRIKNLVYINEKFENVLIFCIKINTRYFCSIATVLFEHFFRRSAAFQQFDYFLPSLPITSIFTTEDTEFHGGKGRIRTKTPCFSKLSNGQQYSVVNSSSP